jgi:hypothetical protein
MLNKYIVLLDLTNFAQKHAVFQRKNGVFLVKNGQTGHWYCPKADSSIPAELLIF